METKLSGHTTTSRYTEFSLAVMEGQIPLFPELDFVVRRVWTCNGIGNMEVFFRENLTTTASSIVLRTRLKR